MSLTSQKSKAEKTTMTNADNKWVYGFSAGLSDGRADMRNLLGGMSAWKRLGLPLTD